MHRLWPWDLYWNQFYTETETSLLHVHFSLTGSMIVLVGWHNLEYIRNMQIHNFTHRVHVVFPRTSLLGAPAIAHGGNFICKCHGPHEEHL